ncbi:MAG: hypothetical protein HUJ16_00825 [Kangiella sp.]|nr:hypothetical protein [Kangiella sp.]
MRALRNENHKQQQLLEALRDFDFDGFDDIDFDFDDEDEDEDDVDEIY